MSTLTTDAPEVAVPSRAAAWRGAGRAQGVVASGQVLAGLGNLVFIGAAARLLPADGFGHLAAFVALIAVANLPGAGLAAAGAVGPGRSAPLARRVVTISVVCALALALASGPASTLLGLPVGLVLALALALPAAPLLGLRRGLAYGTLDHGGVVRSLVAEPAARLVLGLGLGLVAGATGAAFGVAAGGWMALLALGPAVGRGRHSAGTVSPPDHPHQPDTVVSGTVATGTVATGTVATGTVASGTVATGTVLTGTVFVILAVLQHQDLVLANRLLDGPDAGAFAAISTLGGLVAFATATLPLVMLPSARHDDRTGLAVALGAAVSVAAGAVAIAVIAAPWLVAAVVGPDYTHVAPLVPAYMAAMGALGVGRVMAARWCGLGRARPVLIVVAAVAVAQGLAVSLFARTPGEVVAASAVPLVAGAVVLSLPAPALAPMWAHTRERAARLWRDPEVRVVLVLAAVALLVRLATERSIWVDEAISIRQAQLPMGEMLADLRATDVHPPLHFMFLWVSVRVLGTAEWAVRLPSILCGVALVPVLYGTARELFDRRTALVAALLAVPAPFLVWYSQEARMYSLFMLIGVLGIWAEVVALRRGSRAAFVAWALASAALMWTQWFAVLPLLVQQVVAIVHLVRCRLDGDLSVVIVRRWLGSLVLTGVLLLPLLPYLSEQLAAYGQRGAGLELPGSAGTDASAAAAGLSIYAALANGLWALVGYHNDDVMVRLGAMWPLAMLGCLLLLGRRLQRSTALLVAVAIVPAVLLFVIAHSKRDLFELRYFVLSAPVLLLVVARAVTSVARTRAALVGLVAGLVALSSLALVDQQLNGTNPRLYDFRGAVAEIERTAGPDDVIAHAPGYLDGVLHYYAPEIDTVELADVDPDQVDGQIYVVVTERFLTPGNSGVIGDELADLEQERGAPTRFERPNVVVWRFP